MTRNFFGTGIRIIWSFRIAGDRICRFGPACARIRCSFVACLEIVSKDDGKRLRASVLDNSLLWLVRRIKDFSVYYLYYPLHKRAESVSHTDKRAENISTRSKVLRARLVIHLFSLKRILFHCCCTDNEERARENRRECEENIRKSITLRKPLRWVVSITLLLFDYLIVMIAECGCTDQGVKGREDMRVRAFERMSERE